MIHISVWLILCLSAGLFILKNIISSEVPFSLVHISKVHLFFSE